MLGRLGVVFILIIIWHRGSTLSGEGGSYGCVLVHGGWDMIPCVLGPDIGALCEKSGETSKDKR